MLSTALQAAPSLFLALPLAFAKPVEDSRYGIGFDFTPSSANSAVSFANGSNIALARVEGSPAWRDLMWHLSIDLRPRFLHYPPSHVQIIAEMIRSLSAESEKALGHPIVAASASIPLSDCASEWGAPYSRLIKESFEATNVQYLEIVPWQTYDEGEPLINPGNSVLAGHGLGLCQPYYTSSPTCSYEQDLPAVQYLMTGYHANAIEILTTNGMSSAYDIHAYRYTDYHLGADARHSNPQEDYYWEGVRDVLRMPMAKWWLQQPSKVILYGEFSNDKRFRRILREVFQEWVGFTDMEMPEWIEDGVNATFAAAFGAADLAKRKPFFDAHLRAFERTREVGPQIVL